MKHPTLSPTARELEKFYQELNKTAFGGKLPRAKIEICQMPLLGQIWYERNGRPVICVNEHSIWTQSELTLTLLHEMVHLAHPKWRHSKKFHREVVEAAFRAGKWGIF